MIACTWPHICLYMAFPLLVKSKARKYTYMCICTYLHILHEAVHLCTLHNNVLVTSSVNLLVNFESTKTKYVPCMAKHPWRRGWLIFEVFSFSLSQKSYPANHGLIDRQYKSVKYYS